ncbi:50S ribosomal protein L23 [Alphaproteobacteria bacterium]|nr:50S ribosomal protein L23 [Alphaproteobacteria bacterium]GHS96644.1 50S ribosomal protein L23 [Alphaproteobacteria bacterium]
MRIKKKKAEAPKVVFKDYDVLRYPVQTEKSTKGGESNQYFFVVRSDSTKADIKSAVERVFSVKVKSVQTLIRKGKLRTFRGHKALLSDTKRAMVRLEDGDNIILTTGV